MTRKEQLLSIIEKSGSQNDIKAAQLIDEIIFLEEQLQELKKLPFMMVSKKNPAFQQATPASRQYKELLQQYNASLRLLFRLSGDMGDSEEDSPLRQWLRQRLEE
jgi:hypothetical protein